MWKYIFFKMECLNIVLSLHTYHQEKIWWEPYSIALDLPRYQVDWLWQGYTTKVSLTTCFMCTKAFWGFINFHVFLFWFHISVPFSDSYGTAIDLADEADFENMVRLCENTENRNIYMEITSRDTRHPLIRFIPYLQSIFESMVKKLTNWREIYT